MTFPFPAFRRVAAQAALFAAALSVWFTQSAFSEMEEVFSDDFEGWALGDEWSVHRGFWSVQDGALTADGGQDLQMVHLPDHPLDKPFVMEARLGSFDTPTNRLWQGFAFHVTPGNWGALSYYALRVRFTKGGDIPAIQAVYIEDDVLQDGTLFTSTDIEANQEEWYRLRLESPIPGQFLVTVFNEEDEMIYQRAFSDDRLSGGTAGLYSDIGYFKVDSFSLATALPPEPVTGLPFFDDFERIYLGDHWEFPRGSWRVFENTMRPIADGMSNSTASYVGAELPERFIMESRLGVFDSVHSEVWAGLAFHTHVDGNGDLNRYVVRVRFDRGGRGPAFQAARMVNNSTTLISGGQSTGALVDGFQDTWYRFRVEGFGEGQFRITVLTDDGETVVHQRTFTDTNFTGGHAGPYSSNPAQPLRVDTFWLEEVFPPEGRSFADWQVAHFSEQERLDPAVSGPPVDPNGEGVPNLLRYALNLAPRDSARASLPLAELDGGRLGITFHQWKDAVDLVYEVQVSDDLIDWQPVSGGFEEIVVEETDEARRVTVREVEPMSGFIRRFLRLVVRVP